MTTRRAQTPAGAHVAQGGHAIVPDHTPESLGAWFAARNLPAFRARQVLDAYFRHGAHDLAAIDVLPKALRASLARDLSMAPLELGARLDDGAGDAATIKAAFRLADGATIETVLIREPMHGPKQPARRTVCISTQAGCAMGCRFCASGLAGLARNLTTGEIVDQVAWAVRQLRAESAGKSADGDRAARITNVVVMGVGEPLANVAALLGALGALIAPWGFGLSPRRITVSTVGLIRGLDALIASGLAVNLAISLHAPDDATRARLIPTSRALGGLQALLDAGQRYFAATGREVTYEYLLIPEVNATRRHAEALGRLLAGRRGHVNLIPYNRVDAFSWSRPTEREVAIFKRALVAAGLTVTVRKRKGSGIDAACGQLRLRVD